MSPALLLQFFSSKAWIQGVIIFAASVQQICRICEMNVLRFCRSLDLRIKQWSSHLWIRSTGSRQRSSFAEAPNIAHSAFSMLA